MSNTRNIDRVIKAISAMNEKKTTAYDTEATVRRIEDGVAWVHIDGGVDETPVKLTIDAKEGDRVQVRVGGGTAFLVGNGSAPPTDDRVANIAMSHAETAEAKAMTAYEYAGSAKEAAGTAWNYAEVANNAANSAITQLSIVEDVAGTLDWITEHGSYVATSDVTVQPMKIYFELIDGDYVPIVNPDPSANPSTAGWYELDVSDSQAQYIMAHLAVTSAGLWVLPASQFAEHELGDSAGDEIVTDEGDVLLTFSSDPQNADGYKVLLADSGMTIYDNMGVAVAHYGTTTTIGDANGQHIYIDTDSVDFKDGSDMLLSIGVESDGNTRMSMGDYRNSSNKAASMLIGGDYNNTGYASLQTIPAETVNSTVMGQAGASTTASTASAYLSAQHGTKSGYVGVATTSSGSTIMLMADALQIPEYTKNNWLYYKIGNRFIGWYASTASLTIGTQVGNVYSTSSSSTIALPVTLASVLHADVQVANSSYAVWSSLFSATTQTLYYRALSASSRSSATYDITAYVVGTLS